MHQSRTSLSLSLYSSAALLETRRRLRRTRIISLRREDRALSQFASHGVLPPNASPPLLPEPSPPLGEDTPRGLLQAIDAQGEGPDAFGQGPRVEDVDLGSEGIEFEQFQWNAPQCILEAESYKDQEGLCISKEGVSQSKAQAQAKESRDLQVRTWDPQAQEFESELQLQSPKEGLQSTSETRIQDRRGMEQTLSRSLPDQDIIDIEHHLLEAEHLLFTQGIAAPRQMGVLSSHPCTRLDFSRDGVLLIYSAPSGRDSLESGLLSLSASDGDCLESGVTRATLLHYRVLSDGTQARQRQRQRQQGLKTRIVIETSIAIDLVGCVPPATLEGGDFSGLEETHGLFSQAMRKRWLFRRENAFVVTPDRIGVEMLTGIATLLLDERDGISSIVVQTRQATLSGLARHVVAHTPIAPRRTCAQTRPSLPPGASTRSFPFPSPASRIAALPRPRGASRVPSLVLDSSGVFHAGSALSASEEEEIALHSHFERSLPEYCVVDRVWDRSKRYVLVGTRNLSVDGHAVLMLATPVVFDSIVRYAGTLETLDCDAALEEIWTRMLVRPLLVLRGESDAALRVLGLDASLIQDERDMIARSIWMH